MQTVYDCLMRFRTYLYFAIMLKLQLVALPDSVKTSIDHKNPSDQFLGVLRLLEIHFRFGSHGVWSVRSSVVML